jgi:oligopeptide transport system permease protein
MAAPQASALPLAAARPTPESGLWRDAVWRFRRNPLAVIGLVGVVALSLLAIFAPVLAPHHYAETNYEVAWQSPSWDYPFGTDGIGRDIFSRVIYGSRISMMVGVVAQAIALAIGLPLGIVAGYRGGVFDFAVTRVVDVMAAFPRLLFVILVMALLGSGLTNIFIAIGLTGWIGVCRLARAQVLSLKQKEFVLAGRAAGAPDRRLIMSYLLPNAIGPIITFVTLGIPEAIFTEAGLSFIGFGVNPPTASWGQMVGESVAYLRSYWHLATFPAAMIALTMLSFTLAGDGLRDALDPTMSE